MLQQIAHEVGMESCKSAFAQLHRLQGADPGDVVDVTVPSWICCSLRCGGGTIVGDRPGT